MKDKKSDKADRPVRPFVSLSDRRKWVALKLEGIKRTDRAYYQPLLDPSDKGKEAYLAAFDNRFGCGKKMQPSDDEMAAVLFDVALDRDTDHIVMTHCDQCLPCLMHIGRLFGHFLTERPGTEWSAELAKQYPMAVKGWDNDKFHLRVYLTSLRSGPSFAVYGTPFAKEKKPLIIGSAAGVLGTDDCPIKAFVLSTQKAMEKRAKTQLDFAQKIDPVLIAEFSKKLGFDVDDEIYEFLAPAGAKQEA